MVKTTLLKTGLLFVLVFALSAPSAAPAQTCTEYAASRVTERTMSDRRAHGRLLAADAHLTAVGDFDGDGRTDEAFFTLLVDGNYVVVACLEDGKRAVRMPRFEVRGPGFCCYGIHTLPPGIHLSRCAKGYNGPCSGIAELELDYDAILFFRYESAGGFFYWSNGKFKQIMTSD